MADLGSGDSELCTATESITDCFTVNVAEDFVNDFVAFFGEILDEVSVDANMEVLVFFL